MLQDSYQILRTEGSLVFLPLGARSQDLRQAFVMKSNMLLLETVSKMLTPSLKC